MGNSNYLIFSFEGLYLDEFFFCIAISFDELSLWYVALLLVRLTASK